MAGVEHDPSRGFNAAVAAEIRGEMARRNVTQRQLADATGLSLDSIKRYTRKAGPSRGIDVAVLYAMCEALDVDPRDVVAAAQAALRGRPPRAPSPEDEPDAPRSIRRFVTR